MDEGKGKKVGYVYVLTSNQTDLIKIGGTDYPPLKRIREINSTAPYKNLGPWTLADFRQVTDWRATEYALHYTFRSKLNRDVAGQRELFSLSQQAASEQLQKIDPILILGKPKVDRLFQDEIFAEFILKLFSFTGLTHWLDQQGAWTFVLFPATNGGRYFTINIGPHEVAFSTLPKKTAPAVHMILMDKLILDFEEVGHWLQNHAGSVSENSYASALPRSAIVHFEGSFNDVIEFLQLAGVRRALIAYWSEALIELKERNSLSTFSRFHNWNAVAEIQSRLKRVARVGREKRSASRHPDP